MGKKKNSTTRREFISRTGIGAAGMVLGINKINAKNYKRIPGSGEKIRVGFIGAGNRGTQLLHTFMTMPDCEIAALCDVYEPYVYREYSKVDPRFISTRPFQIPKMGEVFPGKVERYLDYRKMLENKNIDAVVISTPDHWHALQTIHSVQSGKDVYVEKPVSKTIEEGRAMIKAANATKQIVTVGLNRRASSIFQKLAKDVPAGKIGKVTFASACHVSNMYPSGIGRMKPENPPEGLNWDAWLGPRAFRPYQYNIAPYMFRWWEDYANQISNNGIHYLDLIRFSPGSAGENPFPAPLLYIFSFRGSSMFHSVSSRPTPGGEPSAPRAGLKDYFSTPVNMCNHYSIVMTATKRIPVSEPVWAELSSLRKPGQTYDELLAVMVEHEKKKRFLEDIDRIEADADFVEFTP